MATDFVLEAVVRSASASDAVGLCAKLLRQESTGFSAVTALLERIRLGMEEEAGIRTILQGIRGACAQPSAVCDQLLQLLPFTTPPAAVVEAVPYFVGDDPSDVSRVVKEYKELLSGDQSMLVHIAGSLHDLHLDADTRLEVSAMTLEALSIVDEEDVPVVVRTLFKAARERESAAVVSRVRTECSELSMSTVAVLVDVMADAFSINESVARAFLVDITDDVASAAARGPRLLHSSGPGDGRMQTGSDTLSTLDVVGLLLLLPHRRHVVAVHAFLDKLYRKPELLPTDVVVSLAERSGESPWACLASPILELGLWAALGSTRTRVRASAGNGSSGTVVGGQATSQPCGKTILRLRRAGARILMAVFEGQPNARGTIVSCCLAIVGIRRLPPPSMSLSQPLTPIGLGKGGKREKESAAADALLESCSGALDLLLHLSKNRADLMSPFANAVGDLILGGADRSLHPLLLDKAAGCLASMMRHSNAMVNELMNHVQKQVFFLGAGVGGMGLRKSLASGDRGGNSGCGGFQRGRGGIGRFGDQGTRRRSAIVLATHLIRAGVLEERDADALLGWAVRLLSLLRGGVSSLDTVATALELLLAAILDRPLGSPALLAGEGTAAGPRLDRYYHGGNGSDYGNSGSSGSGSSGWRMGDERRAGWARAGASTAGRCLVEIGVLRMARDTVHHLLPTEEDEELVPTVAPSLEKPSFAEAGQRGDPSSPVAVLRARDIALAWWREGPCSMFESAQTLHRSWLAALALSARSSPTSGVAPSSEPSNRGIPRAATSFSAHEAMGSGSDSRRGMTDSAQAESWVRAWLSMPVWPFSEVSRCGEEAVKDTGGYWGLAGEPRTAGSYELWRIQPTECAWQGKESTQRLVEAGAACIAARALLSATARHLLSATSEPRDDDEGDEAALCDGLVWRYLELGVRGRVCVFALRRAARALTRVRGNRRKKTGGSTKKYGPRAGTEISTTKDLDAAAARLEEGLSVELMPLDCLCRLVNNSSETRVAVITAERDIGDGEVTTCGQDCVPSSIDLVAYTELLRTVAARLPCTLAGTTVSGAIIRTAPLELEAGGSCAGQGASVGEPRMSSLRALDVGALFRGAAACSRALPAVRKLHATPNRPVKPERSTPSKRGSTPRKRQAARGVDPDRGYGDGTRRTRCNVGGTRRPATVGDSDVDWGQTGRGEGGARRRSRSGTISRRVSAARWLENDREKKKAGGEGDEEELSDAVFSEEGSEESERDSGGGANERDTDDDYDYRDDDNDDDDDEEEEFQFEEVSPRRGKKRKPSRGVRQSDSGSGPVFDGRVAGKKSVGPDPCRGTPGLSLCQFWRYRLLLEVLLVARSADEDGWEEEGGGRRDIGAGSWTKEVMDGLRFSTLSGPISVSNSKTSTAAGDGTRTAGDGDGGTAARWGGGDRAAGDWVFSELSGQLERAEDGLLAAMIVEVMSVLSSSLGTSEEVAALAWKGLRAVYPQGWGDGYVHLGGVFEGLRREGTSLLASPVSLRLFLEGYGGGGGPEGGKDSFNRFRGQLVFPPQLRSAMLASKTGLPSLPFIRHAFLCHWALAGRMGRSWALAAAVTDIETFLLGALGSRSGHATRCAKKNSHGDHDEDDNNHTKGGAISTSSSPSVLCQENFDVFLATVVKLLPASITLATPSAVMIAADARVAECAGGATIRSAFGDAGARSTDKGRRGGEGIGKVARAPGIWGGPYEEAECLGVVLECLVETCKESLEAGTWAASSGSKKQLVALGRLLRRYVLPVTRCTSQALRALEGQLERSLTWRCQQALMPEQSRQGGRPPSPLPHPGDSQVEVDYGAPGLCRGLLDQCDLCADGVRALCSAVRAAETCSVAAKGKERGDGLATKPSSLLSSKGAGEPHRAALDRVVKVIPGIVLQSDQLSTAVDNARKVLQIPRSSAASASSVQEMGKRSSVQRRSRRSSRQSRQLRCASARLSSLFVSGGGGTVSGRVLSGSSDCVHERGTREKGRLSVGAELRGRWSRPEGPAKVIDQWRAPFGGGDAETGFGAAEGEEEVGEDYRSEDGGKEAAAYGAVRDVDGEDEDQDGEYKEVDQFRAVGGGWGVY